MRSSDAMAPNPISISLRPYVAPQYSQGGRSPPCWPRGDLGPRPRPPRFVAAGPVSWPAVDSHPAFADCYCGTCSRVAILRDARMSCRGGMLQIWAAHHSPMICTLINSFSGSLTEAAPGRPRFCPGMTPVRCTVPHILAPRASGLRSSLGLRYSLHFPGLCVVAPVCSVHTVHPLYLLNVSNIYMG